MKNYCDFCKKETQTTIDYEPDIFELANGEKVSIKAKIGYCLECGETKNIKEFTIENYEEAAHVSEKGNKYI